MLAYYQVINCRSQIIILKSGCSENGQQWRKQKSAVKTHHSIPKGHLLPCSSCHWSPVCIMTDTQVRWRGSTSKTNRFSRPRQGSLGTRWNPLSVYLRLWKLPGKRGATQLRRLHALGPVVCVPWSSSTLGLVFAPSTLWPRHRLGASLTSTSTATCQVQLVSFILGSVK